MGRGRFLGELLLNQTTDPLSPRVPGTIAHSILSRFHHRSIILDRKSTRLNSSHSQISYAVFCLKKNTQLPGGWWMRVPLAVLKRRGAFWRPNPRYRGTASASTRCGGSATCSGVSPAPPPTLSP